MKVLGMLQVTKQRFCRTKDQQLQETVTTRLLWQRKSVSEGAHHSSAENFRERQSLLEPRKEVENSPEHAFLLWESTTAARHWLNPDCRQKAGTPQTLQSTVVHCCSVFQHRTNKRIAETRCVGRQEVANGVQPTPFIYFATQHPFLTNREQNHKIPPTTKSSQDAVNLTITSMGPKL